MRRCQGSREAIRRSSVVATPFEEHNVVRATGRADFNHFEREASRLVMVDPIRCSIPGMRKRSLIPAIAIFVTAALQAQGQPPVSIAQRLDTPQARVIVATLQPHMPVNARAGHATDRVLIYLDEGAMTVKDGDAASTRIEFRRGDVRWRAASGPYVAENLSDQPIRILEIDLKSATSSPAPTTKLDPVAVDPQHYKVAFENERVRVLRVHYEAREKGATHEHILNRIVLYLNDHPNAKADDVRVAGAATHAEENASDSPADRIAVELK
jgi:hypothetical protein